MSLDKQRVNICHFLSSPLFISEMHQSIPPPPIVVHSYSWRRGWDGRGVVEEEEGGHWAVMKVRLPLLPLISCFRLFPLNHAAAHNAVKAPQVEEGDGPKQSHGNNLLEALCDGGNG